MKEYDYLIVGAGLFGAVFAHEARCAGKRCLVIDKRGQRGGNLYCEDVEGIHVHKYGAHIFHTDNKEVWDYVNSFVEFNRYTNSPLARFGDKLYNLPFNMNTFYQLWGVKTPAEAKEKIEEQRREFAHITEPANLEEQALKLCGKDIYRCLIKGYTEKQGGRRSSIHGNRHAGGSFSSAPRKNLQPVGARFQVGKSPGQGAVFQKYSIPRGGSRPFPHRRTAQRHAGNVFFYPTIFFLGQSGRAAQASLSCHRQGKGSRSRSSSQGRSGKHSGFQGFSGGGTVQIQENLFLPGSAVIFQGNLVPAFLLRASRITAQVKPQGFRSGNDGTRNT